MDPFDIAILSALQADGAMTNAALSEKVNLSASQVSRRRQALEAAGIIEGYSARLNLQKLGFGVRAVTRVNLRHHGKDREDEFARFIDERPEISVAFSVSGDADYILDIRVVDLTAFADFIHNHLLPHPQVSQVRSEIVLRTMKDRGGVALDHRAGDGPR
ncbi:Lrp/AsnC family transcriptional regulator [Frigidibacter oleivorans]|uniref:Lrp/AsnC family transcriptional regulator n=1 Tax=Frigidibacter oleivorans TaxID=2487129 RepID=UPI001F46778D|nr:Lrp/AsnC family transcriptional regulator [Frigidibacter oleivorans]